MFAKGRTLRAVSDVSLTMDGGECLGSVGESGCGKSTLARAILGFVKPAQGRVLWRGRDVGELDAAGLREFRRSVQPVFQNPLGSLNPRMTVGDIRSEEHTSELKSLMRTSYVVFCLTQNNTYRLYLSHQPTLSTTHHDHLFS